MKNPGTTLADLYAERAPLYEKYADLIVNCQSNTLDETVEMLIEAAKN